jgi:antitoxin CcdA
LLRKIKNKSEPGISFHRTPRDNQLANNKEQIMKQNAVNKSQTRDRTTTVNPQNQALTIVDADKRRKDQEFIKALNEFTARAGLLSEDPFFGGI